MLRSLNRLNCQILVWLCLSLAPLTFFSCDTHEPFQENKDSQIDLPGFPSFITPTEDYFDLRISGIQRLDEDSYRLKISGSILQATEFSLEELKNLELYEQAVTIECIHNQANGKLIGTAEWKGFRLYDLLLELGIKEDVSFVKYISADGYFTYNTLEELKQGNVMGALYMNDEPIPPKYGFPLRIIFPGYYGVRQPGWVEEIQLLSKGTRDFWSQTQFEKWSTDSAMSVDSKIFSPSLNDTVTQGEVLSIAGAAYGSKRISAVEISLDNGESWLPAKIRNNIDQDYVWVFWELEYTPHTTGPLFIQARASGEDGRVQAREDTQYLDGINAWPWVTVYVKGSG